MEQCPVCGRIYQGNERTFCLNDGNRLVKVPAAQNNADSFYTAPPTMPPSPSFSPAPYSPPQAKKTNYLLIFGGIGAALAILLIGAAGLLMVVIGMTSAPPKTIETANTNVSPTPVALIASEKYKPELIMAIKSADDAQANAYATYDVAPLHAYYTGEALKSSLAQVDALKKSKNYQHSDLENQEFEYFKVNDAGTEAEVRVVETWTTLFMQTPSGRCLALYKSQRQPQNIYLKKADKGWMVDVIVYDAGTKQVASPCPKTHKR